MIFLTDVLRCALFSLTESTWPLLLTALCTRPILLIFPKTRVANDRFPFVITFHPVNNSIKPIVNRNSIYITQILALLIFLVNARFFFLLRKIAISALFWLKEHCLLIKNLALFVVPANDVWLVLLWFHVPLFRAPSSILTSPTISFAQHLIFFIAFNDSNNNI